VTEGLRERKKRATRAAIHDRALELFERRGFAGTTIDQIADAADVSRATVFSYFPTKEDIVFGDAPLAVEALAAALAEAPPGTTTEVVREWLGQLSGWIEPRLLLQRRLEREVPAVAARKLRILRDFERVFAEALERELDPFDARLTAACLVAALDTAEAEAAVALERGEVPADAGEFLDRAVAFATAGAKITSRGSGRRRRRGDA
jgi:AcrR family transcriptional regulator